MSVTPKQAMFVAEYLIDGNATRAAAAAGFAVGCAHVTGARLLKNPNVAAAIAEAHARRAGKLEITAERVLQELAKLAYFDPGKLYDSDGQRIPVHRLDPDTRAAVAAVEDEVREGMAFVTTRIQRIKMADKGTNLERLGKYLKLFGGDAFGATVTTPGGLPAESTITVTLVRPG